MNALRSRGAIPGGRFGCRQNVLSNVAGRYGESHQSLLIFGRGDLDGRGDIRHVPMAFRQVLQDNVDPSCGNPVGCRVVKVSRVGEWPSISPRSMASIAAADP